MKKALTSSQSNPFTSPNSTRKRRVFARTDVKKVDAAQRENEAVDWRDESGGEGPDKWREAVSQPQPQPPQEDNKKGVPFS
ncbi:hypothetical protein GB937_010713 [Aspergillus fischeri]|nr:hypothetical protein GB937_010713 [Aspergillus fischeri]